MPVTRADGALVAMSWVAAQATACAPIPRGTAVKTGPLYRGSWGESFH